MESELQKAKKLLEDNGYRVLTPEKWERTKKVFREHLEEEGYNWDDIINRRVDLPPII